MPNDPRLYQRDPRTRRLNPVSLPRSGAFGNKKTIDKAYIGGPDECPCELGIGCFIITDPQKPSKCDFVVWSGCLPVGDAIINDTFIVGCDSIV